MKSGRLVADLIILECKKINGISITNGIVAS
jgi:hypothetical protein